MSTKTKAQHTQLSQHVKTLEAENARLREALRMVNNHALSDQMGDTIADAIDAALTDEEPGCREQMTGYVPPDAQHTPGPWKVEPILSARTQFIEHPTGELTMVNNGENDYCIVGDELILATLDSRPPEAEANARLIAAAPDMLAALEDARDYLQRINGLTKHSDFALRVIDACNAAIARAKGDDA